MSIRLAITSGEPAGIGPDLCLQISQQDHGCELVVIADPDLLKSRAQQLGLEVSIRLFDKTASVQPSNGGEICVYSVALGETVIVGEVNKNNSAYVLVALSIAAQGALDKQWHGIVTPPNDKEIINEAGTHFTGHTEYFRDYCGVKEVVMMLATNDLRVALVTTHLPLRDVADAITPDLLTRIITILNHDLITFFGVEKPRILVAGLNPHAGEDGHLGHEEIDVISPTLEVLRKQGIDLIGPLPADTLYTPKYLKDADATLAMYHDQGLPVLKYHGFGRAANITLGLPIIRTSVDHGTALDLAGTNKADCGSLLTAIEVALEMAKHHGK